VAFPKMGLQSTPVEKLTNLGESGNP
jgi:hypothetical protein